MSSWNQGTEIDFNSSLQAFKDNLKIVDFYVAHMANILRFFPLQFKHKKMELLKLSNSEKCKYLIIKVSY